MSTALTEIPGKTEARGCEAGLTAGARAIVVCDPGPGTKYGLICVNSESSCLSIMVVDGLAIVGRELDRGDVVTYYGLDGLRLRPIYVAKQDVEVSNLFYGLILNASLIVVGSLLTMLVGWWNTRITRSMSFLDRESLDAEQCHHSALAVIDDFLSNTRNDLQIPVGTSVAARVRSAVTGANLKLKDLEDQVVLGLMSRQAVAQAAKQIVSTIRP